jgi:hypothetical protein
MSKKYFQNKDNCVFWLNVCGERREWGCSNLAFSLGVFLKREDWFKECVDLVAPDGLVFFTDGSGSGVFSDIMNVRESYALGFHGVGPWTL